MVKRKIIEINEDECTGCGDCVPACNEGALQIIDGKARLISDLFCDGLGACLGECPTNAMQVVEREAQPYDERKVMEKIVDQGPNVVRAHLEHLQDHGQTEFVNQAVEFLNEKGMANPLENKVKESSSACGCPGAQTLDFSEKESTYSDQGNIESQLRQWPVQLHLVNPSAPYFKNTDLLVSADCVPFAYGGFHQEFLKDKALVIGCPKLDEIETYKDKIKSIIEINEPKSITVAIMEVPCCGGMYQMVEEAVKESNVEVPLYRIVVGLDGGKR